MSSSPISVPGNSAAIAVQAAWRAHTARKRSFLATLQFNKRVIKSRFVNELGGYHIFNEESVKEATWEEVNRNLVRGILPVTDAAHGNHLSGKDNQFGDWGISNKTAKATGKTLKISSYRLTCVCNDKNPGTESAIQEEIKKRDGSYDYYSILARDEHKSGDTTYKWYVIPKTCAAVDPCATAWTPKFGARGTKKDQQVGWKNANADISFAMSSQLWLTIQLADIERYCICQTTVRKENKKTMSYAELFAKLQIK